MTFKKRGLGRGLEVLLADTSSQGGQQQTPFPVEGLDESAKVLLEHLHQEKINLLHEAETLRHLIAEFEMMIRAELQ